MKQIRPREIRYIKLGAAGRWEPRALARGEVYFGMPGEPTALIGKRDWEGVARHFRGAGYSTGLSTYIAREHREFETLSSDCLWITFSGHHLWWGFAEPEVVILGGDGVAHGTRMRRIIGGWRNTSIDGKPLTKDSLSTKLTQVAAYRHTMCGVREAEYLVRKINGHQEPIVVRAAEVKDAMAEVTAEAIGLLHWADFEDMVDLIFARSGWQRVSRVGGAQRDLDLELEQPTTQERAFVQVKSQADQSSLDRYVARFDEGNWQRMFFVCHTPKSRLTAPERPDIHLWTGRGLAQAVLRVGLQEWVLNRVA